MFLVDLLLGLGLAGMLTILFSLGTRKLAGRWTVYVAFSIGALAAAWLFCAWLIQPYIWDWHFHALAITYVITGAAIVGGLRPRRSLPQESTSASAVTHVSFFALSVFFSAHALVYVTLIGLRYLR